jgi:hypothetical protein
MLAYNQFQNLQKSSNIADRYRLEQIQYPQKTVYSHLVGYPPVVQHLAAVLAVLVKWNYNAIREHQSALAGFVTQLCNPTKNGSPVEYTNKQISRGLHTLKKLGFLIIPNQLTRESINKKHSKIYFFDDTFKTLLEHAGDRKVSYISPRSQKEPTFKSSCSTINSKKGHAPVITSNIETAKPRVENIKNIPGARERSAPQQIISAQQKNNPGKPLRRDLKKIHLQIIHWLGGCEILTGQTEAIMLTAKFLEHQHADPVVFWVSRWSRLLKSEKSNATRQIIKSLRNISPAKRQPKPTKPVTASAVQVDTVPVFPPGFDVQSFLAGLLLDKPYTGPGQTFIKRFRAGDETTQELMQIDLQQKIKTGKIKDLLFD